MSAPFEAQPKKRLLVVEDDPELRLALELRMTTRFEVTSAEDGVSALRAAKSSRPDVMLLDLGLPAGDGFRVLEWIAEDRELCFVPTVVLSGREGEELETQVRAMGAAAFVQKPAEHAALVEMLFDLCRGDPRDRKRILVVEDDDDVRRGLGIWLRSEGYEVLDASDGAMALAKAREFRPDGIMLDIGLPAGDGIGVLQRLRASQDFVRTPMLVMSGQEPAEARARALAAGATGFLSKPPSERTLREAVKEMF